MKVFARLFQKGMVACECLFAFEYFWRHPDAGLLRSPTSKTQPERSPRRLRRGEMSLSPFHFAQRNMFFFAAILPKRTERVSSHKTQTVNEILLRREYYPCCAGKIKSPQPNVPRVHDDADWPYFVFRSVSACGVHKRRAAHAKVIKVIKELSHGIASFCDLLCVIIRPFFAFVNRFLQIFRILWKNYQVDCGHDWFHTIFVNRFCL